AKELKKYMEFIKTPEGKHISKVWAELDRATIDANSYISRTININLTPVRQAAREKWEKEHPQQHLGQAAPVMIPSNLDVFDQKNAASRDSSMKMRQREMRVPPVKIPADSTVGK